MLFIVCEKKTHIWRADGSWFSVPSLDWLDSGEYAFSVMMTDSMFIFALWKTWPFIMKRSMFVASSMCPYR